MKKSPKKKTKAKKPAARATRTPDAVMLAAECTVNHTQALHAQLAGVFARAEVTIDVGAVQKVDAASVQLLAAFVYHRRADGKTVAWRGASAPLTSAARCLGLGALFA